MKKTLLTAIIATGVAFGVHAQGTLDFANIGPNVDAPIFLADGTTGADGAGFSADLVLVGSGAVVAGSKTDGFFGGYFIGPTLNIASVAPGGQAQFIVRAWDTSTGATWESATVRGQSAPTDLVTLGGAGVPPSTPAELLGLSSFNLTIVPEPTTFALAGLGAAALLIFRRRD